MPFLIIFTLVAAALLFNLHSLSSNQSADLTQKNIALLVIILGLLPALIYVLKLRNSHQPVEPIPFLPIVGVIYAIYFALPALRGTESYLYTVTRVTQLSSSVMVKTLWLILLGWCSLLVGFYFIGQALPVRKPLQVVRDLRRVKGLAFGLMMIGAVAVYLKMFTRISIPISFRQIIELGRVFFEAGLGILVLLSVRGYLSSILKLALWFVMIPAYLYLQIGTGSVANLLFVGAYLLFLVWGSSFRVPWVFAGILLITAILFRGSGAEFRKIAWYGEASEFSPIKKSHLFVDIVQQNVSREGKKALGTSTDILLKRTSALNIFSYAVHLTPDEIPYWKGGSYHSLPSMFIPRFLWPNKPVSDVGQRFGHRYHILYPQDTVTSVNLPQLIEFYINFGDVGVPIGMLILGTLYRLLYLKLNRIRAGDGAILFAAIVFSQLLNIESDFSLVFGGVLQRLILLYFIFRRAGTPVHVVKGAVPS